MSPRGVPRTGLYLFCTACGLFATALAPQLYGMALVGPLGFIWGATLRFFIVS